MFHDDQHGTAIVMTAALINALKLVGKKKDEIKLVINGAGAAGIAIARFLLNYGVEDITICDLKGILCEGEEWLNTAQQEIAKLTNRKHAKGTLADAMNGADVFVGVSGPNCVTKDMVKSMAEKPVLFPCANPVPEISPKDALEAGAFIVGTGSSEYPNQTFYGYWGNGVEVWLYVNMVFGLVVMMFLLPIFHRLFYKITGNVWTGAIACCMIFIMMTISASVSYIPMY